MEVKKCILESNCIFYGVSLESSVIIKTNVARSILPRKVALQGRGERRSVHRLIGLLKMHLFAQF